MSAQKLRSAIGPSSCAADVSITRRAHLRDRELAQFLDVLGQHLLQLTNAAHPQLGVGRPVGVVECAAGRLDRAAHVVGGRVGGDAEHLLGGRVDRRERAAAARHQLAVDEQLTLAIVQQRPYPTPASLLDNCPTRVPSNDSRRPRARSKVGLPRRARPGIVCGCTCGFSGCDLPAVISSDNLDMCPAMPWSPSQTRTGETPRNRRQEETFRKVLTAGVEMLRESSYADLTVRAVAARAKVAPATAYTYFSSKNHLIAEVYLDLVRQVPYFTDVNDSTSIARREGAARPDADDRRRARGRGRLHDGAAAAATTPAVRTVRDRIGAEIHRRIRSAVGPDADHRTVSALEMTYFGALVHAGSGAVTYRQIADRLSYVVGLILGEQTR